MMMDPSLKERILNLAVLEFLDAIVQQYKRAYLVILSVTSFIILEEQQELYIVHDEGSSVVNSIAAVWLGRLSAELLPT